jgi:hypothetical protein
MSREFASRVASSVSELDDPLTQFVQPVHLPRGIDEDRFPMEVSIHSL